MRRVDDYVVSGLIAAGGLASVMFFRRITVYPVAVALLLPATAAIVYALLRTVGKRSAPRHVQGPIALIGSHVVAFIVGVHVLTVCNLAGVAWARALGPRAAVVLLGAVIVAIGNALPRLRPNLALGIRTTKSLDDTCLWSRVHRRAGHGAVALGCITCVAGLSLHGDLIGPGISVAAIALVVSIALAYRRYVHD
ncbi:MAG TPA: SdpI family protein [Vicinamibacterales bacterium]|nr:SdpI family protein [Vicinamibacterales bacterium]